MMRNDHAALRRKRAEVELRATAYHEAGHAVAAIHQRIPLHGVTIKPEGDSLGRTTHANLLKNRHIDWDASAANERRMERQVAMSLAGPAAEQRFRSRHRLRKFNSEQSRDDYDEAIGLIDRFTGSNNQTQRRLDEFQAHASAFVRDHWNEIRAVAEALLHRTRLSSQAIRRVIRDQQRCIRNGRTMPKPVVLAQGGA
jgi:ATP-dependent Zn protease